MNTQERETLPSQTASSWAAGAGPVGKNGLAVAAMVLGVIGLISSIVFVGGLFGVIGLILGIVALKKAKRTGVGRGMSITGVVTSFIAIVASVLVVIFMTWYADKTQKCYDPGSLQRYEKCVQQQLNGH